MHDDDDILEIVPSDDDRQPIRLRDHLTTEPPTQPIVLPIKTLRATRPSVLLLVDARLMERARRVASRTGGRAHEILAECLATGLSELESEYGR